MSDNIGDFHSEQPFTPAVRGGATQSNGIYGNTASDKDSAVYGEHLGNGIGVFGRGGNNAGEGIFGQTNSAASGVYGKNTATGPGVVGEGTVGVGVLGRSDSGFAMRAEGDVSQARAAGGWVKALVFLSSGNVIRSFNSQREVPSPTCVRLNTGVYSIDFKFAVNDRYVVVTPIAGNYSSDGFSNEVNPFAPLWWPPDPPSPFAFKFFVANIVFDGLSAAPSAITPPPGQRQTPNTMVTVMTFQPQFIKSGAGLLFQGFQVQDTSVCVAVF